MSLSQVTAHTGEGGERTPTHPSVAALLETIRRQYPSTPFLALGQTVFWDEPTKAVWRRLLDILSPESHMIAGVHDTDYFAKLSTQIPPSPSGRGAGSEGERPKFAIVPHDDSRTRDLWSAAGELSALFGSESIPTRHMFLESAVPFDWLTKGAPAEKQAKQAALTTAWGWRGLVRTDAQNIVAGDIPVREFAPALYELLAWGFRESLDCLADDSHREAAEGIVNTIRGWIDEYLEDCSESCRLTDLYETILPKFYSLLLSAPPRNFETTASTELFRFNTDTASAARFAVLNIFLSPTTRDTARRAYNTAVAGSGIYPLDNFGLGAIPFDLVVPGTPSIGGGGDHPHGRGTIFLRSGKVFAQIGPDEIIEICSTQPATAVELAVCIEAKFGRKTALVGKAVILADMVAAEHLVLFHETASGYTGITRQFNDALAKAGIELPLHPIVRIEYPTWYALGAVDSSGQAEAAFVLPSHLASTFGKRSITAREFSQSWCSVIEAQRTLLAETRKITRLRDLVSFLETQDPDRNTVREFYALTDTLVSSLQREEGDNPCWCDLLAEYERCQRFLHENAKKSATLRDRIDEHRAEMRIWQKERQSLEQRKGEDWRAGVLPLVQKLASTEDEAEQARLAAQIQRQEALRVTTFTEPIHILKERIASTKTLIASFKTERRRLERSSDALHARAAIARITYEAQASRLMLVRNAYLTIEGLEHTHLRPTSWWLPFVDRSGQWFDAMVTGTKARFEDLRTATA